jgi:hypothetical protein
MKTEEIRDLLYDYARGMLSVEHTALVEEHLKCSDDLRKELARIKSYYEGIDAADPVNVPADFLNNVHAKINPPSTRSFLEKLFSPLHVKFPLELTGILATVTLVVLLLIPQLEKKNVLDYTTVEPVTENISDDKKQVSSKIETSVENELQPEAKSLKENRSDAKVTKPEEFTKVKRKSLDRHPDHSSRNSNSRFVTPPEAKVQPNKEEPVITHSQKKAEFSQEYAQVSKAPPALEMSSRGATASGLAEVEYAKGKSETNSNTAAPEVSMADDEIDGLRKQSAKSTRSAFNVEKMPGGFSHSKSSPLADLSKDKQPGFEIETCFKKYNCQWSGSSQPHSYVYTVTARMDSMRLLLNEIKQFPGVNIQSISPDTLNILSSDKVTTVLMVH